MVQERQFSLHLPPSSSRENEPERLENEGVVVIVGANGSGKTRLGAWLELDSPHKTAAHRVSAQKSLDMPHSVSPKSVDAAEKELLYGYAAEGDLQRYKKNRRWKEKPSTVLLSDFDRLMVYLFSEDYDASTTYRQKALRTEERVDPPTTKLDVLRAIWEETLPHRSLLIGGGKVDATVPAQTSDPYSAAEMSDGERVVFYLIGECLAAPEDSLIIIDEPELHLHKSIQGRLWNAIQGARPDCQFVYLTHDVAFAASRVGAPKVWLKSYQNVKWDWDVIPDDDLGMPEDLLLELVGSRKPILLVEGDRDSLDAAVYSACYQEFTVVPVGSSSHVIQCTGSFRALQRLHKLECFGIVDRDFRTDEEISYLEDRGVKVLSVGEVENLLLMEPVLVAVAKALHRDDEHEIVAQVKEIVLSKLEQDEETVKWRMAAARIERLLRTFDIGQGGREAVENAAAKVREAIDAAAFYEDAEQTVQLVIRDQDYDQALKVYRNKGLMFEVARLYGFEGRKFREYVQRLLREDTRVAVAMKEVLPENPTDEQGDEGLNGV